MSSGRYIVRFGRLERIQHAVLFVSFLLLAATGLPLLFSDAVWARPLALLFGGFNVAGVVHRVFAVALIAVFASSSDAISTKPKPRDCPVNLSVIIRADATDPCVANKSLSCCSVVEYGKPPT